MGSKTRHFYRQQTAQVRESLLRDKDERIDNMKKEMRRLDEQLDAVVKDTNLVIANQRFMLTNCDKRIANLKQALKDLIDITHSGQGEPEPSVWEEAERVLEEKR
jgi:uncharacterized protein YoxC